MLSFLKKPYPCNYGQRDFLVVSFLVGVFISMFLGIFQPFGIANQASTKILPLVLGFGFVTFFVCAGMQYFVPKLFPSYYREDQFNVGKEIFVTLILILFIGIGNYIYLVVFWHDLSISYSFAIIGQTFLIAVFPVTFLTMLQFNRLEKSNMKASQEIKLEKSSSSLRHNLEKAIFTINAQNESTPIEVPLEQLLYVESVGNYANVASVNQDKVQKQMYRTTLKALDESNDNPAILRCHRSFIINLGKVEEISGNAQGLKLSIKGTEEVVPVSRKYIKEVRNYFSAN